MSDVAEIAGKLSEAQRARLTIWPHDGSTFRNGPDAVARELCDLGIGVMMPWKHGCQMGLPALGLKVHQYLASPTPKGQGLNTCRGRPPGV